MALGILKFRDGTEYNTIKMIMEIMPSVIAKRAGRTLSSEETEIERATYIRDNSPEIV